jgi:2-C-methyl-D-erythritol 2,4-cyclodiphosphate synthase
MSLRVGIGYDIHARVEGRPLVIGGLKFPTSWGLAGHSDADVLCHAIADALLGAVALGDIGQHFPPGEPRWKDASSIEILRMIRAMLDGRGATIVNVDATVVALEPQLSPHRQAMCARIAQGLRIGNDRVSVKATTNEGLDALGRGEGIAAWATAMLDVRD